MQVKFKCLECDGDGAVETTAPYDYAPITYGDCPMCEGTGTAYFDVDPDDKTFLALSNIPYMQRYAVVHWMMEVAADFVHPSQKQVAEYMDTAVYLPTQQKVKLCDEVLARMEELRSPATPLRDWVFTIESEAGKPQYEATRN